MKASEDVAAGVCLGLWAATAATSWVLLSWGCGWGAWWWTIPVALAVGFFVGGAAELIIDVPTGEDDFEPAGAPASPIINDGGKFQRLKRAVAMSLHPDRAPAAEKPIREALFKELWGEVERIENS
jgi:hypothetical protein